MACLAPNKLADGTEVACRECKLCQLKAKNDWVGRNIAESKTAKFCYVITATYGRGRVGEVLHERAVILTYSDCQKLLKLLRRHGYEVRFFITGEYGSEKGRAHWNIILYSQQPLPAFAGWDQYGKWLSKAPYQKRFNWVQVDAEGRPKYLKKTGQPAYWWPHGFVHIDQVSLANVKYVCKYVLKDFDANGRQGHKGQSKDPPLGMHYFRQLAEKYVGQGLAPQTPEYRFPEARTRDGEVIRYWLKGRPLEMFLQHFIDAWRRRWPDRPRPRSEYVDLYEQYGRVVNDENAMLVREEFPRGESRDLVPSGEQIKRGAEQARYERAVDDYGHGADELRQQDEAWINGAKDEQERQERKKFAKRQRTAQWYAFNHTRGRHWYKGHGWALSAGRTEPCACCDLHADTQGPDGGDRPPGGERQWLGKVGQYNADHSDTGKAGGGSG